jgi:hypothetical protein
MNADEQEALSRFYAPDAIRLVILKSGAVAVFNNAKDLCGILKDPINLVCFDSITIDEILDVFYPPRTKAIDLADLGLLDDEKRD